MRANPRYTKIYAPNAGHIITRDNATGLTWSVKVTAERLTINEAKKFIADLNSKKYCGFAYWRLPTRVELLSLVDDTRCIPAIDTDAFPNTPIFSTWTSTRYADGGGEWIVDFYNGHSYVNYRRPIGHVRAVLSSINSHGAGVEG